MLNVFSSLFSQPSNHQSRLTYPWLYQRQVKLGVSLVSLTALSVALSGCQSMSANSQDAQVSNVVLMGSPEQMAQQHHDWFHKEPSIEEMAKEALIKAVSQHLKKDHVIVSESRYQYQPMAKKGSIDTDALSLYVYLMKYLNQYQSKMISSMIDIEDLGTSIDMNDSEGWESEDEDYFHPNEGLFRKNLNPNANVQKTLENLISKTPEQLENANMLYSQYVEVNGIGQYSYKNKKISWLSSYDLNSPTQKFSIKLPVQMDFKQNKVRADMSAVIPLFAMIYPNDTPLPEETQGRTIDFNLPPKMVELIGSEQLFEMFLQAYLSALQELDEHYFIPVDIRQDVFAKQLHASQAVQLNLNSQVSGELMGYVAKYMSQSLYQYLEKNPDKLAAFMNQDDDEYRNKEFQKKADKFLKKWKNKASLFKAQDIGQASQLLEAILPISINHQQRYYLSRQGHLLAKQDKMQAGYLISNIQINMMTRTRYNQASFDGSRLAPVLLQTFQKDDNIDALKLIEKIKQDKEYQQQAEEAREYYEAELDDLDDELSDDDVSVDELESQES